jgi:hypothetical protein
MRKNELRKIVRKVIAEDHRKKVSSRNSLSIKGILFEQDEEGGKEKEASGKIGDAPKGSKVDKTTNVKVVDPIEIVNQLLSGDDNMPMVQAAQASGKPWISFTGAEGKAWVEKLGPEVVVARIKSLAKKIPKTGLPKSVMPFLPGPDDAKGKVADVEDALTPGGDYNIDIKDPFKEAWQRGARYLMEQEEEAEKEEKSAGKKGVPPTPNTFVGMDAPGAKEFMTAGLEDGEDGDDVITINVGGSLVADKAIPTQSNILIYKSLGMAVNGMEGGPLDAWAGTKGEILDGHHRWAATMLNNPGASMGTAGQVDLGALSDPHDVLKYLTAIGNALGNKTKTESLTRQSDSILLERWNKLAGLKS